VEDLCEGLVTRRSDAAARRTKALETVRQTAMPVRSIGKAKPRGWPRATTLPCILGFVAKSAPDTQRAVDREDAAQRSVSPLRVTLQTGRKARELGPVEFS
jgi:hypothetical protein